MRSEEGVGQRIRRARLLPCSSRVVSGRRLWDTRWHRRNWEVKSMAAELILEFEGVTEKEYNAVNKELGIDSETGQGNWPDGLIAHSAGVNEAGRFVVIEVWDTPEHQAKFMEGRLGEALVKGGIEGPPASITWIELVAHHHVGK